MANTTTKEQLNAACVDMHAFASGSLLRIRGMARCALRSMESPSVTKDLESIADVLMAIAIEADGSYNDVAVAAEAVGVETIDPAWKRRLDAFHRKSLPVSSQEGGAA